MWKIMPEQQQRGAQSERRKRSAAPDEGVPEEATSDRAAQHHDYADLDVSGGEPREDIDYPAENIEQREGDITPTAPDPRVNWDDVVQPERAREGVDDLGEAGEDIPGDIEKGA